MASFVMRKYRLIGAARNDSVTVDTGYILGGQHQDDTRMLRCKLIQISEVKASPMMWRSNDTHAESIFRNFIRAEDLAAFHLTLSIETNQARTNCDTSLGNLNSVRSGSDASFENRADDFAIPRAAA